VPLFMGRIGLRTAVWLRFVVTDKKKEEETRTFYFIYKNFINFP